MKFFKNIFKSDLFPIFIALGLLLLFSQTVYPAYYAKRNMIFVKSDYLTVSRDFSTLTLKLQTLSESPHIAEIQSLIDMLTGINNKVLSNTEFVKKVNFDDLEEKSRLINLYSSIENFSNTLIKKFKYTYFISEVKDANAVLVEIYSKSDNYDFIAESTLLYSSKINTLKSDIIQKPLFKDDREFSTFANAYVETLQKYFTELYAITKSIPSYIDQNDRDKTRELLSSINELSAKYESEEKNYQDVLALMSYDEDRSLQDKLIDIQEKINAISIDTL